MTAPTCPADRYVALTLEGRDAASFLQGQLTQDVLQPGAEPMGLGALLTPQGRVLATAWVGFEAERRVLVVPADLGDALLAHLRRFVLRAKLTLAVGPLPGATREALQATVAGRLADPATEDWSLALVRAGLPEVVAATSGEWIPQMLNLDLVGGISFRKGCYTGQEIVARTQHLGRIKRRMRRLGAPGDAPAPGTALVVAGTKVGEVVQAAATGGATELLAVLTLEAPDGPPTLPDGRACDHLALPYPID